MAELTVYDDPAYGREVLLQFTDGTQLSVCIGIKQTVDARYSRTTRLTNRSSPESIEGIGTRLSNTRYASQTAIFERRISSTACRPFKVCGYRTARGGLGGLLLSFAFRKNILREVRRVHRVRPASVESEMGDNLGDLLSAHPLSIALLV